MLFVLAAIYSMPAHAAITTCGNVAASDVLTQDISGADTCLTITANDVEIDCQGFTITYNTDGGNSEVGIDATGRSGVRIRNCNIRDSNAGGTFGSGILFNGITQSLVTESNISTNGTGTSEGIRLISGSTNNNFTRNIIRTTGSGGDNSGIHLLSTATNNRIDSNIIFTNGTSGNRGVRLTTNADDNNVTNNNITTNGTSSNNNGIAVIGNLGSSAEGNRIIGNTIITNGSSASNGIVFQDTAGLNIVDRNTITVLAPGDRAFGVFRTAGVQTNVEATNTVLITSDDWIVYNSVDRSNFTNTTFQTGQGFIRIKSNFSLQGLDSVFSDNLNISFNRAFLNSTALPKLNQTGTVRLFEINDSIPLVDFEDDGSLEYCSVEDCQNVTFDGENLTYDVSHFSVFAGGPISTCGDIHSSGSLNQSITSNDTCLNITGSNLEISCEGHSIFFNANGSNDEYGIYSEDQTNITINGCFIRDINVTGSGGRGIQFENVTFSNLTNNTIQTNGTSGGHAITLSGSQNNTVGRSTLRTQGSAGVNAGVQIVQGSHYTHVHDTLINTNGTASSFGFIVSASQNSTLERNNVTTGGPGDNNHGINVLAGGDGTRIIQNILRTSGGSDNRGVSAAPDRLTIAQNTIITNGTSTGNDGIRFDGVGYNITLNNITTNGTGSSIGIDSVSTSAGTRANITNNTIHTQGTGQSNFGIEATGMEDSIIAYNTINATGTRFSNGVSLGQLSDNVLVKDNTFWSDTTVDPGSSTGINISGLAGLGGDSVDHRIFGNTIIMQGTSSTGISIFQTNSFMELANNTIETRGPDSYAIEVETSSRDTRQNFTNTIINNSFAWLFFDQSSGQEINTTFTNLTFKTRNGSINFERNITFNDNLTVNQTTINISFNKAFVNSSNLSLFNTSALITLNNITNPNAVPLADFDDDGTFEDCPGNICTQLSFVGGVFRFNVTRFSAYAAGLLSQNISACGNVTVDGILNQTITSNDTCLTVVADDVTLDCAGNTIQYNRDGGDDEYGVFANGRTNVTVKNCIIRDINATGSDGYGVFFNRTNSSTILNNTIRTQGTSNGHGVHIETSTENTVRLNDVQTNGSAGSNLGLRLRSRNSVIANNSIITNGSTFNDGIVLSSNSANMIIANNTIVANGTSINRGISVASTNQTITRNTIRTQGNVDSVGIAFSSGGDQRITHNQVTTFGPASAEALEIGNTAGYQVLHNTFITRGAGGNNDAIEIQDGKNVTAINNTLRTRDNGVDLNVNADVITNITFKDTTMNLEGSGVGVNSETANASFFNTTINNTADWILSSGSPLLNFTNTTFQTLRGSINILGNFTVTGEDIVDDDLTINQGQAFLNSTALPKLNQSGIITLHNLNVQNPVPTIDFNDDGIFEVCFICQTLSFNGSTFIFNTTHFTTLSFETGNINLTLSKTDSPDPVNNGSQLTYTIQITVNNGSLFNATLVELYPSNVSFNSSNPAPSVDNDTFDVGNLSAGDVFNLTIVLNVSASINESTNLSNTIELTYFNATNTQFTADVTENTTVTTAAPGPGPGPGGGGGAGGGGGGGGGGAGASNVCPPICDVPGYEGIAQCRTCARPQQQQATCVEQWTCGFWTPCANEKQFRVCTDTNACGTSLNKPATQRECTIVPAQPAEPEEQEPAPVQTVPAPEEQVIKGHAVVRQSPGYGVIALESVKQNSKALAAHTHNALRKIPPKAFYPLGSLALLVLTILFVRTGHRPPGNIHDEIKESQKRFEELQKRFKSSKK